MYSTHRIHCGTLPGENPANKQIRFQIPELKEVVQPYILAKTPNVLSIGRRCVDHGYSFVWEAYSWEPYLVSPMSVHIQMVVEDYIPYIVTPTPAAPAVARGLVTRSLVGGGSLPPAVDDNSSMLIGNAPVVRVVSAPGEIVAVDDELEVIPDLGKAEVDLRAEAVSLNHLLTHFPKNKYCHACLRSRVRRKACLNKSVHREAKCDPIFGKQVTADHVYAHSERLAGFTGDLDLLVIYDRGSQWIEGYPLRSKGADILRPEHKAQVIKDLKVAEQAGGVGSLHASLPSDAKDEPAAPVRTVLSSRLSAEVLRSVRQTVHPLFVSIQIRRTIA